MIKVAVVDDHQMFLVSLTMLLDSFKGMKVVISSQNGQQLLDNIKSLSPDVILLDIHMPHMNGFEICLAVSSSYPHIKILMLSHSDSKHHIQKAIVNGAHGFFTKNSDPQELKAAIEKINDNGFYFANDLGSVMRDTLENRTNFNVTESRSKFTLRELQIIKLAAREYSSSEIAAKLYINVRTVDSHRKRIMERTSSKNFLGVVLFALKNNYLDLEDLD